MMYLADEESHLKRQKCCDGSDDVSAVDRLSTLPDEIICDILSLLPIKSAVATSLLSKSWRLRWTQVTSFDIENQWWSDCRDFVDFVNNMFMFSEPRTIHRFHLNCENLEFPHHLANLYYGFHRITAWLSSAVCQKVRFVDVSVLSQEKRCPAFTDGTDLPGELFTCKTLEILKLTGPFIIKVPSEVEVCLPRLVHLELILVHCKYEEKSLCKLLRGCPVLESFKFERKHWFTSSPEINWSISSPSLKRLEIYLRDDGDAAGFISALGLQKRYKLEIDAPTLEKLVLTDRVSAEISIHGGSIKEADLDIRWFGHLLDRNYHNSIVQLIQGLNHVKILTLSERTVEVLGGATCCKLSRTSLWSTSFEGLTKLVVKLDYSISWDCLIDLINCCPALETLEIIHLPCDFPYGDDRIHGRRWRDQIFIRILREGKVFDTLPRCSLSSLTRVVYKGRTGLKDETPMLLYILNPAIVTKSVEVDLRSDSSDDSPNFELTLSFV
ncbi:OLC1v1010754C1 [Oldenlandia corymbosa var. corymbosa]|uniref:OLC1v1010754C1 n=1 Tax=Oldenlandia corymbosa var. corymbosa TaxID=529605 RepID=A0AAV1DTR8_OLDCO|nr:OLC1v1010754C1 [Oldenlandia corymbosa var. corymbosa]